MIELNRLEYSRLYALPTELFDKILWYYTKRYAIYRNVKLLLGTNVFQSLELLKYSHHFQGNQRVINHYKHRYIQERKLKLRSTYYPYNISVDVLIEHSTWDKRTILHTTSKKMIIADFIHNNNAYLTQLTKNGDVRITAKIVHLYK